MAAPELNELLRQAERLLKTGNVPEATPLVKQAFALDKNNPDVLVLVAQVTPQPDTRRKALMRALQLDPSHRKARALLKALDEEPKGVEEEVNVHRAQPRSLRRTLPQMIGGGILILVIIAVLLAGVLQLLQRANSGVLDARGINTTLTALAVSSTAPPGVVMAATNAPSLDLTGQAAMQTATQLALTQQSMLVAPTLTAAVLAPGRTQTALNDEQNRLNTAIAATQTQSNQMITQTVQVAGLTSTAVIQTQTAATATQQAVAFKANLKGTLATAKTVNGQLHIVLLNADGSTLQTLSELGSDPAWSPDGKKIAFANREHGYWVHVIAADGTSDTELNGKDFAFANTGWPTWSPDGTHLLFEANKQFAPRTVMTSALDGTGLTQVLNGDQAGGLHNWSPDGTQILFTKNDQIWLASISGGEPHSILQQAGVGGAAWSPDGTQIVFDAGNTQDRGLYIMNADGSNARRITTKDVYPALAAWSPDGKYIVALCFNNRLGGNNLCVMNADGTSLTFVTTGGGFDGRISWLGVTNTTSLPAQPTVQPTSTLAVQAHANLLTFGVGGGQDHILQLWQATPDGSGAKALTDSSTFAFPGFSWSPDGQQVAFFGIRAQQFGLYVFDSATNIFQTVIITGSEKPSQSYTVSWSPDGSAIAYMGDDGLYIIAPDGQNMKQVVSLPNTSFHHSPIWSANSQQIAYVSDDDVYVVNRDGSAVKPVTKGRALQAYPSPNESAAIQQLGSIITWTPDGQLAYTIAKPDGAVYTISPDGTASKVFLKQPYILSWSPDGKQLAGLRISADIKIYGIYLLNTDGTGTPQFILKFGQFGTGVGVSSPVWRP